MSRFDPYERARRARRLSASALALLVLVAVLGTVTVVRWWSQRSSSPVAEVNQQPIADQGPDFVWQPYTQGHDLPVSRASGPTRQTGGRAAGFARSELGAALAAIHLGQRIDPAAGPRVFEPTIKEQVIGPDAGTLKDRTTAIYEQERKAQDKAPNEPLNLGGANVVGYHIDSYTPEAATVAVFTAYDDRSQLFSFRNDLRWSDGDWRLVAPTGGDVSTTLTRIPSYPPGTVVLSKGA
jgi:hypothetical protein